MVMGQGPLVRENPGLVVVVHVLLSGMYWGRTTMARSLSPPLGRGATNSPGIYK